MKSSISEVPTTGDDRADLKWRLLFSLRVTVLSVIISLTTYGVVATILGAEIEAMGMTLSTVIPMVVAPVTTWVTSALYLKISGLNRSLQAANEKIERQTERKAEMLRRLSHELRTPAAVIHTMAHAPHLVQTRASSLQDAAGMLLEILDTLRMAIDDGADLPVTTRKVALVRLSRDVAFLAEALAADTSIQVSLDMRIPQEMDDLWVSGDILRLKSATLNLVRNGLLHAEATRMQISVAAQNEGLKGIRLILRVEDNGKGIPQDKAELLFQPHTRGDTQAAGSGLGLGIARDWIRDMNGRLDFAPSPMGGAGFVISVPLAKETPEPLVVAHKPEAAVAPADTPAAALRDGRILLVDDDRLSRFINSESLRRHVAHVDTADSVNAALAHLQKHEVDLILTDYQMPDGTGVDLVRRLRNKGVETICVGLTASDAPAVHAAYLQAGASEVLVKPMPLDKVLAHVRGVTQG